MKRPTNTAWAKLCRAAASANAAAPVTAWHSLPAHSADVAACLRSLLDVSTIERRLATLVGRDALDDRTKDRLAAFAFLHDLGKANTGFQVRWDATVRGSGHIKPLAALFVESDPTLGDRLCAALPVERMLDWCDGDKDRFADALWAVLAHHGAPPDFEGDVSKGRSLWRMDGAYDPFQVLENLGQALIAALPEAFAEGGPPLPRTPDFWHAIAGLIMLADWLGSDCGAFFYTNGENDDRRYAWAREAARDLIRAIGLDPVGFRLGMADADAFASVILPGFTPTKAQRAAMEAEGPIAIIEAETGSGKTEAALWRFARLFAEDRVDGLYFALPTRAAATALFERVRAAVEQLFPTPDNRPTVVLAVPGYIRADGATGKRLPGFDVLWDDRKDGGDPRRARWAAEHPKRFLAATVAVGTIDQALLGAIKARHAHMLAAALLRSLLVVDEVHASDRYMEILLRNLLALHTASGGEAMLLSATLGAAARARLLDPTRVGFTQPPPLDEARACPYPAVISGGPGRAPIVRAVTASQYEKTVRMRPAPIQGDPAAIAAAAHEAAALGAKVLVVRNTVRDALATLRALRDADGDAPYLFRCNGVVTLHHGRFAPDDRRLLDEAVEMVLGRERPEGGLVLVGTQTLEQSLDIDADILFTDLCPADVLLQRLGRLHRHERARPDDFATPAAHVLVPKTAERPKDFRGHGMGGENSPYPDPPPLLATRRLLDRFPEWRIPAMNRRLVEDATHPEALAALVAEMDDPAWGEELTKMMGGAAAQITQAGHALLPWQTPLRDLTFQWDEPAATRLGARDLVVTFAEPPRGPFGQTVARLAIPAYLWRGREGDAPPPDAPIPPADVEKTDDGFLFRFGARRFRYGPYGLETI